MPVYASGRLAVEICSASTAAAAITIENCEEPERPIVSVALNVTAYVPEAVGVPEIIPVLESRESPGASEPAEMLHV